MIRTAGPYETPAAAGGAGVATNNVDTPRLCGRVVGIYVDYTGTAAPATTDVVIKTKGTDSGHAPTFTILTLTNKNTDGWFWPRFIPDDQLGVDLAALAIAEPVPVDDVINIAVAQADDGTKVKCWFLLGD